MNNLKDQVSIILPPPNITGELHIGHAYQQIIMDILSRYSSLSHHSVSWIPGTDHAGIAGQSAFYKYCDSLNLDSKDNQVLQEFITLSRKKIRDQMKKFSLSVNWEKDQFTLDDNFAQCVKKAFCKLYRDGIIYRSEKLVYFDTQCRTVLSNAEVVHKDVEAHLWYITYNIDGHDKECIEVATTRPETLFGDVAIMLHPDDRRYKKLMGKKAIVPISGRRIQIISSKRVDPNFGSGCVKVTPGHSNVDFEVAKEYDLPILNILNDRFELNDTVPLPYQGLTMQDARIQVTKDLQAQGKISNKHIIKSSVPTSERSGIILESKITKQWFLSCAKISNPLLRKIARGDMKIYPPMWKERMIDLIVSAEDWCISRQIHLGHPIPAWLDDKNNVYVGASEVAVRKAHNLSTDVQLSKETSVLDTWFSSCLWPLAIKNWHLNADQIFTHTYLVTGFDILFFWIVRMSLLTNYLAGQIPAKHLLVTGLIRDAKGSKMSKSKGNVLNPMHVIDGISLKNLIEYYGDNNVASNLSQQFPSGIAGWGLDVFRLTMATISTPSNTVSFNFKVMQGNKHFCNKILHVCNFISINFKGTSCRFEQEVTDPLNLWIIEEFNLLLNDVKAQVKEHLRIDLMAKIVKAFAHDVFCNTYLQMVRILLDSDPSKKDELHRTVVEVYLGLLSLLYPIIPDLCMQLKSTLESHLRRQLKLSLKPVKSTGEQSCDKIRFMIDLISDIRSFSRRGDVMIFDSENRCLDWLGEMQFYLRRTFANKNFHFVSRMSKSCRSFKSVEGIILIESGEIQDKSKLQQRYDNLKFLLSSEKFISRAPADVVAKRRRDLQQLELLLKD